MKKLILIIFLLVLLVGNVSAFEFDNVKQYNDKTKVVEVKNSILGIDWLSYGEVATEKLNTPQNYKVAPYSYQLIAEREITQHSNDKIGGEIFLYDLNNGFKEIERQIDYKYKSIEEYQSPIYKQVCGEKYLDLSKQVFMENCTRVITGYETLEREVWIDINLDEGLDEGTYTIGMFTYVDKGDKIEWIVKDYGILMDQWASWEASTNVGLVSNYPTDTTDYRDNVSNNNLTETANMALVSGKIGNAINKTATGSYRAINTTAQNLPLSGLNTNWTASAWVYHTAGTANSVMFGWGNSSVWGATATGDMFGADGGNYVYWGGASNVFSTGIACVLDEWILLTWVYDDVAGNISLYINGTLEWSDASGNSISTDEDVFIGADVSNTVGSFIGAVDMFRIWNRTLSPTEITDIQWNSGSGNIYEAEFDSNPTSDLNQPANAVTVTNPSVIFNATGTDDFNVTNMSLYVNESLISTNSTPFNNTLTQFPHTLVSAGFWNWTVEVCDNSSQCTNATSRNITYSNDLTVTLNNPINAFNSTSKSIIFNATGVDDTNLVNMSFILNATYNGTNTTVYNNTLTQFPRVIADGYYNWTTEVCDNVGACINATARNLTIDSTLPAIAIISPTGDVGSFVLGNTLNLNWSINDTNLDSCWFNYNGVNTTLTCVDGTDTFTPVTNVQNLTLWANDTIGNENSEFTNWSYSFLENSVTVNSFINETSSQDFEINLTTDITILSISAILNYNETILDTSTVTCDGGNCILENTIDIPLVTSGEYENKTFFWEITIFNGTDSLQINTTDRDQNVSRIHLEACNTTFTDSSINFTAWDEQTLGQINPYNFNGTFEFWIGTGDVKRNNSFVNASEEFNVCILPNAEMMIDAVIDYDQNGTSGYTSRFYYLDNYSINSTLQNISMYLLNSSSLTSFILKVQDDSLLPVDGALIEIHRYYPGEGIFRIVQIAQTDDNGKSIGFFETETVDYKFIIKKDGAILLETGQQKVIPETSPFTLTFNTGDPLEEPWATQVDLDDLNSSLVWNDTTGIITYTYIDSSGNLTLARLLVVKESLVNSSADETLCNTNLSISSGTLTCTVGSTDGFYVASAFITRNVETLDKQFTFQIETLSGVVGTLGLFYGWFLVLIASFMFKFNEIAGIWAITITVFMVNLMGLINFGGVFVTGTIAVALILTWIMEK